MLARAASQTRLRELGSYDQTGCPWGYYSAIRVFVNTHEPPEDTLT